MSIPLEGPVDGLFGYSIFCWPSFESTGEKCDRNGLLDAGGVPDTIGLCEYMVGSDGHE